MRKTLFNLILNFTLYCLIPISLIAILIYQLNPPKESVTVPIFCKNKIINLTIDHAECIPVAGIIDYSKNFEIESGYVSEDGDCIVYYFKNNMILVIIIKDKYLVGRYFYLDRL